LFLGGYLKIFSLDILVNIFFIFDFINIDIFNIIYRETDINFFNTLLEGLIFSLMLGLKSCLMIFVFI
jgi:hypothetical protein